MCQYMPNAGFWPGPDPRRALWPAVMRTALTGRTHGYTAREREDFPCQQTRLRPVSNENRLVGRPLGVAYGTRLPSRDVRIHGESGVRKTTPSVTMLLFWSAK